MNFFVIFETLIYLRPTRWAVYQGAAPSVLLSRAHQSVRTTSPSFWFVGPCTGPRAGWRECGNNAAAGSWPPPDAAPSLEELDSVRLWSKKKTTTYFSPFCFETSVTLKILVFFHDSTNSLRLAEKQRKKLSQKYKIKKGSGNAAVNTTEENLLKAALSLLSNGPG